jgi:3-phenylpropionate/cinnamic acid dioxygenase small subunit
MTGAVVAPRSTSNWEVLAEREQRDWTYFGRLRHEREKKLRDSQHLLIEADRRQQMKKRRAQRRGTLPQ